MKLERRTTFIPGFDKRSDDPKKDYGIHGGKFMFGVVGPLGAVHFVMLSSFYPESAKEHLIKHHNNDARATLKYYGPDGYDVGYHAHTPQYEDQKISQQECEWLGGQPCYSDGSAIQAGEWTEKFLVLGTDWLWPALEEEYADRFGNKL